MRMHIGSHEYANEADDDVPKPAQSLGTPVPRQKKTELMCCHLFFKSGCHLVPRAPPLILYHVEAI